MNLKNAAGAVLLSLTVVACGGGGGSGGGGGTPPPTGGGGGTPPPPPPPPAITYTKFDNLTGDQAFKTACAGIFNANNVIPAAGFGRFETFPQFLSLDYTASTQTWKVTGRTLNGVDFSPSFGPADIDQANSTTATVYAKDDGNGFLNRFALGNKPIAGVTREYLRGYRLIIRPGGALSDYFCVFGVPTALNDTLPASTITYTSFVINGTVLIQSGSQAGQYDLTGSTATLTANPTNGEVKTTLNLTGRKFTPSGLEANTTTLGSFTSTAVIDGTQATFSAPIEGVNRAIAGPANFGGWFFGPQGIEAGYAFAIHFSPPDGGPGYAAGLVSARR